MVAEELNDIVLLICAPYETPALTCVYIDSWVLQDMSNVFSVLVFPQFHNGRYELHSIDVVGPVHQRCSNFISPCATDNEHLLVGISLKVMRGNIRKLVEVILN